jgi:peptidoglycan/LPS O-acetylase OafA/YrhL
VTRAAPPARIDDLTCARALLAGWVFAYHLNLQLLDALPFGALSPVVARGYLGVDGFFMLSGLVLGHAHPTLRLGWWGVHNFWWRRLQRIYPVHISVIGLLVLLLAAGALAGVAPRVPERFGLDELARHALLLHGWGLSDRWAWNYPSWSISTEWAGYLAFPVLWTAVRRLPVAAAWLLSALAGIGLAAVEQGGAGAHLNLTFAGALPRFSCEFLAGMALARLLAAGHLRAAPWLAPAGLAVLVAGLWLGRDALAVAGLFLLLAWLVARPTPILAPVPGLVFLGELSYAFYMSFAAVEMVLAVLTRRLDVTPADHPAAFALVTTAATFALALALRRWVEQPALRWRR